MERNVRSTMSSDAVTVKEERVWEQTIDLQGVSEAAALAGLYTDHEVKEELVIGPEVLQPPDAVFTADEPPVNAEPSRGGCHPDHTYASTEWLKTEASATEVEFVKELVAPASDALPPARAAPRGDRGLEVALKVERVDAPHCHQSPDLLFAPSVSERASVVGSSPTAPPPGHNGTEPTESAAAFSSIEGEEASSDSSETSPRERAGSPPEAVEAGELSTSERGTVDGCPADRDAGGPSPGCLPDGDPSQTKTADRETILSSVETEPAQSEREAILETETDQRTNDKTDRQYRDEIELEERARVNPEATLGTNESNLSSRVEMEPVRRKTRSMDAKAALGARADRGSPSGLVETESIEERERVADHEPRGADPDRASDLSSSVRIEADIKNGTFSNCKVKLTRYEGAACLAHIHAPRESPARDTGDVTESRVRTRTRARPPPAHTHMDTDTHKPTPTHTDTTREPAGARKAYHPQLTKRKSLTCDTCMKTFKRMSSYLAHKRRHAQDRPFPCDACDKAFANAQTLKNHKRTHTDEKPHACDVCDKKFLTFFNLKIHERVHTGERPYACELCPKRFTQPNALKSHLRVHTGEKPYSCTICNTKFRDLGHLTRHSRVHTGEKPFACDLCDRRFAENGSLKKHRIIHTGEKPFQCDQCEKRFNRTHVLKNHKRSYHSK